MSIATIPRTSIPSEVQDGDPMQAPRTIKSPVQSLSVSLGASLKSGWPPWNGLHTGPDKTSFFTIKLAPFLRQEAKSLQIEPADPSTIIQQISQSSLHGWDHDTKDSVGTTLEIAFIDLIYGSNQISKPDVRTSPVRLCRAVFHGQKGPTLVSEQDEGRSADN